MILNIEDLDFEKANGLVPVVVQDYGSKEVLTLAYVNEEALRKSVETGYAHYFRRSKGRVMKKGETSGHVQRLMGVQVDCDYDALIFLVEQKGVACHLGRETCFHNSLSESRKPKTQ